MIEDNSPYTRQELADFIYQKLRENQEKLTQEFRKSGQINSCYIDGLLPEKIANKIYQSFPDPETMAAHKSIRENKKVAAQMNLYAPILEEIVFAFQDDRIVKLCEKITGIENMEPDEYLYAGGISLMAPGNFLNPHLDNSHDEDKSRYRVLNLLYYVSPNWELEYGGNLELWDNGVQGEPRTIVSKFNRLALMITNRSSFHSVSKVIAENNRCCVSNYYFSKKPAESQDYFHVTSFYGRPEESIFKRWTLKLDRNIRQGIRKLTGKRLVKTKHIYRRDS